MTNSVTVTSPGGSPSIVYNRGGMTIDTLSAEDESSPAPIVRYCSHTVVLVTTSGENNSVSLPDDAEIGDLVEVVNANSINAAVVIYAASGQSFYGIADNHAVYAGATTLCRYCQANSWSVLVSTNG